jgi:hypothetical protein
MRRGSDEAEGFIGHQCAKEHFQKDHGFSIAVAQAERHLQLTELLERLASAQADSQRAARYESHLARILGLRARVAGIRRLFVDRLLVRLAFMIQRTGTGVRAEFAFPERVEDAKGNVRTVLKWRSELIGKISAPQAVETLRLDRHAEHVHAALAAFRSSPSRESGPKQLKAWAAAITEGDKISGALDAAEKELGEFLQPDSLKLLTWVCPEPDDQMATARGVLQLLSGKGVTEPEAQSIWQTWRKELMASYRAVDVRIT